MSKYKKTQPPSSETIITAEQIAKGIQRPNQTREQTKLIAQGIQKGISEYKKQQKAKNRELDKLKKKIPHKQETNHPIKTSTDEKIKSRSQWIPWALLIISWLGMALFILKLQ